MSNVFVGSFALILFDLFDLFYSFIFSFRKTEINIGLFSLEIFLKKIFCEVRAYEKIWDSSSVQGKELNIYNFFLLDFSQRSLSSFEVEYIL